MNENDRSKGPKKTARIQSPAKGHCTPDNNYPLPEIPGTRYVVAAGVVFSGPTPNASSLAYLEGQ